MPESQPNLGAMDSIMSFAHCRLTEWAKWCRDNPAWPARTVLGRLAEEGPGSHGGGTPGPTALPESVAICDTAVSRLTREQFRVIRRYYLIGGSDDHCAKLLRIPKHRYRYQLRMARRQIALEIRKLEEGTG